ncbi:DNA-directed RNA polymerase I subunit Rpa49p [[Candida] jaroonii]|uniref:DNA-directed RNA polymerase I subunit Rpa49p n=1 Tax=[Candida] jaroonii TaxID=467808 RepID=A0ACA9Y0T0_9ASCO|nr:DNA-directed RNA polymerase I subunit Rpa49p [[Candida] jaroonii]
MKRKSDSDIRIKSFIEEPSVAIGSFFNGLNIPTSTDFHLYQKNDNFEMHGENESVEYIARTNNDESDHAYAFAVYDPESKSVELVSSPMVHGQVIAQNKKAYSGPKIRQLGIRNHEQRNNLGETFGTKKAKSAITNLARNRIDSEKLTDVELDIVDSVKSSTSDLPTRQQMDKQTTDLRPIPHINMGATRSEDIYALHALLPKAEWLNIRVTSIFTEESSEEKLKMLPFDKSPFLANHIDTKDEDKLKVIYFCSILLGLYHNRRIRDKFQLVSKFNHTLPDSIINYLLETFTISKATKFGKAKDKSFLIDPQNEDKLVIYIIATMFHINNFLINLQPLGFELNLKTTKLVNLIRIMGGIVKTPGQGEAEALDIPKSLINNSKVATLKAPVKLPDMSKRVRR